MTQSSFLSKSKKFVSFQQTLYPNLSQKEKKKEEGRNDRSMPVTRPVPQIRREREERRTSRVGVSPDYYNYSCGTVINGTAGHFDRSEFPDSMIKNSRGHETMMTERKRERERERERPPLGDYPSLVTKVTSPVPGEGIDEARKQFARNSVYLGYLGPGLVPGWQLTGPPSPPLSRSFLKRESVV